jgi:SAM-dependent methyltransferase
VVATLQVIEHVWNPPEFLGECRRVLRPGGALFVTTPNRLTFTPGSDVPVNPFHTKEFTAAELAELVTRCGVRVDDILGLHAGPRLVGFDEVHGGSFVDAQLGSSPDAWSAALRADVASVGAADFPIIGAAARPVDEALDLLVLARRAG